MELLKVTIKKQLVVQNIMMWNMISIYREVCKDFQGFICKETNINLRERLHLQLQMWLQSNSLFI